VHVRGHACVHVVCMCGMIVVILKKDRAFFSRLAQCVCAARTQDALTWLTTVHRGDRRRAESVWN
jgi:exoribonuclease II